MEFPEGRVGDGVEDERGGNKGRVERDPVKDRTSDGYLEDNRFVER